MSNCCDRFVMIEGEEDSFETWQGLRGPYYTPSVSEDGTLSWTNNGDLQNPAAVNIKGPPGPGGVPGGTTGQIFAKASDEDYDTEWIDQPEMDAEHVSYDSTETYSDGTVGKELTTINSALSSLSAVTEIIDTASGAIASFPDGSGLPMRSLLAQINPVQDLHGYDAPWAGGAGKNKLPMTLANIKTINTDGTWSGNAYTLNGVTFTVVVDSDGNVDGVTTSGTASADSDCYIYYELLLPAERYTLNGCPSGGSATTYRIFATNIGADTGDGIPGTLDGVKITTVRININSGTNVNGLLFKPMIRLESVSDATFAPYSNECPITGWTGLSGYKLNGNLFNGVFGTGETARVEIPTGTTAFTATAESTSAKNLLMRFYDSTGTKVGSDVTLISGGTSRNIRSVTIPSGATLFSVYYQSGGSASEFSNVCVGIGSTFSVSWQDEAGTVYGGTVDVVTGVLTVDRAKLVLDENIPSGTNGFRNISVLTNGVRAEYYPYRAVGRANSVVLSDKFRYGSVSDGTPFIVGTSETNPRMYITLLLEYDTEEEIRAWFASNPSEFVYYLATPQTYQLTPQQIETLLGNNTVFVDTGAVSVTYQASIKGYIDKVLAS